MAKAKTRNGTGVAARAAKDLPEDLRRALVSGPMAAPGSGPCGVGLNEIDDMIRILVERREEMEAESFLTQVNQGFFAIKPQGINSKLLVSAHQVNITTESIGK